MVASRLNASPDATGTAFCSMRHCCSAVLPTRRTKQRILEWRSNDENAFHSAREFAAYLGLVPRQNGSGGKVKLGGISKRGD